MTLVNTFKVRLTACAAVFILACLTAEAQVGPGTEGTVAKFTSPTSVGDSVIVEDKFGKVGVGTSVPTSKLTVAGTIESLSGGIKFPDGSVQTSAMNDPALSAFQTELSIHWEDGEIGGSDSFDVPSGKRLVIENLTLRATTGIGGHFGTCSLSTFLNGTNVHHQIIPTFIRTGTSAELFGFINQVRMYAEGKVFLQASRGGTQIIANMDLTISGYLVDLPAAARETGGAREVASVRTAKRNLKKRSNR